MKNEQPHKIPFIDKNTTVDQLRVKLFLTYQELSDVLGYNVAGNSIKSWIKGKYRAPEGFENQCISKMDDLIKYSNWKLKEGFLKTMQKKAKRLLGKEGDSQVFITMDMQKIKMGISLWSLWSKKR